MRYSLALYCSDLTYSSKDYCPIGVLAVDETNNKYGFKHLNALNTKKLDPIMKAIWVSLPEIIEQRFETYCSEPNHEWYKLKLKEYHGFISQLIYEWSQSSICFSDSIPLEGTESIEQITEQLFKRKVLQRLD